MYIVFVTKDIKIIRIVIAFRYKCLYKRSHIDKTWLCYYCDVTSRRQFEDSKNSSTCAHETQ